MRIYYLAFLFLCSNLYAAGLEDLEKYWGLNPVKNTYRHHLEGIRKKNKNLEVSVWYEDASITQNALPDRELFCRFLHSFAYGRNLPRANRKELPPSRAFRTNPEIEKINFYFFAVVYSNRPSSPYWDQHPATAYQPSENSEAKLRVVWTREEQVIPYLSLSVSRQEWNAASEVLRTRPYYAFSDFNKEVCDSLFLLLPNFRSNFASLNIKN